MVLGWPGLRFPPQVFQVFQSSSGLAVKFKAETFSAPALRSLSSYCSGLSEEEQRLLAAETRLKQELESGTGLRELEAASERSFC